MRRLMPLATLNALLLVILSLMVLAISVPGCEPYGAQQAPPVPPKKADIEIEHRDGKLKIDVDRKDDGGLKIDIEKDGDGVEKKDASPKEGAAEKTQAEPRRRAVPLRISSLA